MHESEKLLELHLTLEYDNQSLAHNSQNIRSQVEAKLVNSRNSRSW